MLHGALGAKCCEWMMRKVKGRGRRGSGREGFSAHGRVESYKAPQSSDCF